jgi:hypothetical protein
MLQVIAFVLIFIQSKNPSIVLQLYLNNKLWIFQSAGLGIQFDGLHVNQYQNI